MAEYFSFDGSFSLAKVHEPEFAFHKMQWTVIFTPKDDVELGKIMATGLKLNPKKDEKTGKSTVTFRRPVEREFSDGTTQFNPPALYGLITSKFVDKETNKGIYSYPKGKAPDNMIYVGEATPVPNGTKGKINISVYNTAQGKGHRLESLYITELGTGPSPESMANEASPVMEEVEDDAIELNEKAPW